MRFKCEMSALRFIFCIFLLPIIIAADFDKIKDGVNTFEIDYDNDRFLMNGEPFR